MMRPDASWRSAVCLVSLIFGMIRNRKVRRQDLRNASDVVNVIAQRDEQVEEQLRATGHHLHLHGAAALESSTAADDESKVVGSQLGVCVWGVGVGVAGRGEDCAALDAGFCSLFKLDYGSYWFGLI
jgi:hypothetical protein